MLIPYITGDNKPVVGFKPDIYGMERVNEFKSYLCCKPGFKTITLNFFHIKFLSIGDISRSW